MTHSQDEPRNRLPQERGNRSRPTAAANVPTNANNLKTQHHSHDNKRRPDTKQNHPLRLSRVLFVSIVVVCSIYVGTLCSQQEDLTTVYAYLNNPLLQHEPSSLLSLSSNTTTNGSNHEQKDPCQGYDGILWITQGDLGGAFATVFYLFGVNQLLYAKQHNLLPWIHMNHKSRLVYDPIVHKQPVNGEPTFLNITLSRGLVPSLQDFRDENNTLIQKCPGKPFLPPKQTLQPTTFSVQESGVWNYYFEPVSGFRPQFATAHSTSSCRHKPLVQLQYRPHLLKGLHHYCTWSVKAWRYGQLPAVIGQPWLSLSEWLRPMRETASQMVAHYIRPRTHLVQKAVQLLPQNTKGNACLALHIRHSDKGAGRKRISLTTFLPYVQAFAGAFRNNNNNNNNISSQRKPGYYAIYLATDSSTVWQEIQHSWPPEIVSRIITQGDDVVRSPNATPTFRLSGHHRTNSEVLVDILAMAQCNFLLHGLSAVSEAVHYINPILFRHNQSVNLDLAENERITAEEFADLVQRV